MSDIRLEDATIRYGGEWLTASDLTEKIQKKMESGDMKFADLASALEELNKAMESTVTLEERLVITKKEYDKLKSLGGGDDQACVRKAILAYISGNVAEEASDVVASTDAAGKSMIKCTRCKTSIEVVSNERPIVIDCPQCGTSCRVSI